MRFATSETRSRPKPSRSIVSRPMRTFLSDVTSGLQMRSSWSLWSSARFSRRRTAGPVSITTAAYASSCCGEDGGELGRADHVGLLRPPQRRAALRDPLPGKVPRDVRLPASRHRCRPARPRGRRSSPAGSAPSVKAESPNCRSRSTRSVFTPERAAATARFVARTVLPLPPFGEKTVTTSPGRRVRGSAPSHALRSAKISVSADCGRTRTSTAPVARPASTMPLGSPYAARTKGALVRARAERWPSSATSGSEAELERENGDVGRPRASSPSTDSDHRQHQLAGERGLDLGRSRDRSAARGRAELAWRRLG